MFKKEILAKIIAYYKYCGELIDGGMISGNIHLIKASDIDPKVYQIMDGAEQLPALINF